MQQRSLSIPNKLGLHARAAAQLVRLAATFDSTVHLARAETPHKPADAKSIFNVLLLAAAQGTPLVISADGADEEAALNALCELIESKFGEPE